MSAWPLLNRARIRTGPMASTDEYGFNGAFELCLTGQTVRIIASDGGGWQHVSVSLVGKYRTPCWGIMCQVKDMFWEPTDWVCQFHPAESEYVDIHPGCLHLWRPTMVEMPHPPSWMVGPKGMQTPETEAEKQALTTLMARLQAGERIGLPFPQDRQ